jgi:hypothetical protein
MSRSVMYGRTQAGWHELERALARELGLIRGPLSDLVRLES